MKPGTIVIQKQVLEIEKSPATAIKPFFDEWSRFLRNQFLPELYEALSPLCNREELVVFDSLEVNITFNNSKEFIAHAVEAIQQEMESRLKSNAPGIRRLSPVGQQIEVLRSYLLSGTLPAWFIPATGSTANIPELLKNLAETQAENLKLLLREVAAYPNARKRLKNLQHPIDPDLLIKEVTGTVSPKEEEPEKSLVRLLRDQQIPAKYKREHWENYLASLSAPSRRSKLTKLLKLKNIREILKGKNLQNLFATMLKQEADHMMAYLADLEQLADSRPDRFPKAIREIFFFAAIRYKIKLDSDHFQPGIFLQELVQEWAYRENSEAKKVWNQLISALTAVKTAALFDSPLPDLILQYAPRIPKVTVSAPEIQSDLEAMPPVIEWLIRGSASPLKETGTIEREMTRLLRHTPEKLSPYLALIFGKASAWNRLLDFGSIQLYDELLLIYARQNSNSLQRLLQDFEAVFRLHVFPENHFAKYQKDIRKQLPLVLSDPVSDHFERFKKLWIKLTAFYGMEFRQAVQAVPIARYPSHLRPLVGRLLGHRTTTEIRNFLKRVEMEELNPGDLPTEASLRRLEYQLHHHRSPWWPVGAEAPSTVMQDLVKKDLPKVISWLRNLSQNQFRQLIRHHHLHRIIRAALIDLLKSQGVSGKEMPHDPPLRHLLDQALNITDRNAPKTKEIASLSPLQKEFAGLQYFLTHAFPPQARGVYTKKDFEKDLVGLSRRAPGLLRIFFQQGLWQKKWDNRLLESLSINCLMHLAALLFQQPLKKLDLYRLDMRRILPELAPKQSKNALDLMMRRALIQIMRDHRAGQMQERRFLRELIEALSPALAIGKDRWLEAVDHKEPAVFRSSLVAWLPEIFGMPKSRVNQEQDEQLAEIARLLIQTETEKERMEIFINNAGLILLGPWLPQYFSRLDLLSGRVFKDRDARERAVHLLQYLVTKQSETPEYMLPFNKILCGIPVDEPVPEGITMSPHEIDVSEQMLQAVISNWQGLGNTSEEGLRGSFIAREGKLEAIDDYWKLEVEPKAYDVLLQSLPWSISMVMLPWMEKRIQTDWK